ncbi:hypothetical protein ACFPM7_18260 [Actinokineospora guangxiensis]|uniref:DUF2188 domain-containing protein n=1 Tax=Actinokineospora guangxiensis TaxID=1490288 RepID=A0ABW0ERY4_9PSEU
MFEPIMANYTPDGDDWTVEVTAKGETRTATAPGLIAARDAADQLVDELVPDDDVRTVVHTLDGDAFEFTQAYLAARLARPSETTGETQPESGAEPPAAAPAARTAEPAAKPAPAKSPAATG